MWHGQDQRANPSMEELRWEPGPPISKAKALCLSSEMTLTSSETMELLEFSVLLGTTNVPF